MKSSLWSALGDVLVPATSKYRQDQVAPTAGMLQLVLPRAQDTLSAETGGSVALCDAYSFTICL